MPSHDCIIEFSPTLESKPAITICDDELALIATTSANNGRYDRPTIVRSGSIDIPAGLHSTMQPQLQIDLPAGWTAHVNPEGAPYYLNETDTLCIVTDVPLTQAELSGKVSQCIKHIQGKIKTLGLDLPADCELYVHTDGAANSCEYYLVDHGSRTEFWLQEYNSDSLGLPAVASAEHLKLALQEHYWIHVEYFPHRAAGLDVREELVDILRQARVDQLTSADSTSPICADQCAKFIELLDVHARSSIYVTWITARVWQAIARHRFQIYYGEEYARLSRDQKRLEPVPVQASRTMDLSSFLLFGLHTPLRIELEMLFLDGTVYTIHWQPFAHAMQQNWRETSLLSTGLLIANAGFLAFSASEAQKYIGLASTILSLGSLAFSMALLHRYTAAQEPSAAIVAEHLAALNHHAFGFAPLAALYSLPRALACWAVALLAAHVLLRAVHTAGFAVRLSVVVSVVVIVLICGALGRAAPALRSQCADNHAVPV